MVVSGEVLLRKLLAPVCGLRGTLTRLGEVPSEEGRIMVSGEVLLRKLLVPVCELRGTLTRLGEVPSKEGMMTLWLRPLVGEEKNFL